MRLRRKMFPHILVQKLVFDSKRMSTDEVSKSHFKTPDSRDSSRISSSTEKDPHFLISAATKGTCSSCKMRTKSKCQNCNKYFCNIQRTGRECFDSHHRAFAREAEEKFADDEMSSDEMDEDVGHPVSNSSHDPQTLDEVCSSHFKTSDSTDVSKVCPSPEILDSEHIFASGHHASGEEEHRLIPAPRRSLCFYCKKRTRNKCPKCDKHFCNVSRTGRECFNSYHKPEQFADNESSSDEMHEDIDISVPIFHGTSHVEDKDDSDVEVVSETKQEKSNTKINHTPLFVAGDGKVCFYCKTRKSNWCCKACGKSLCLQKTGKKCFRMYHSSPREAKRPNMKGILKAYARKSH